MASLLSWFAATPAAPERVPTDVVIPLYGHDDTRTNRNVSLEFTMRFEEVLDAEKLSGALWKLLERPGWRKLGARMRLNDKGKLEYHIPAEYTKARPPINYTNASHDVPISQHPIGANFPRSNGTLQVFNDLGSLTDLTAPKNNTAVLADWIYTDKAQLGLHIVTFTDATLVTLTWIHTLLDAMGRHALLRAWTAMLEGREEDIPEFWGYDFDPLEKLGAPGDARPEDTSKQAPKEEEFVLKHKQVSGWNLFKFVFNYLWEIFFYPAERGRMLVIPAAYFAALKKQAHQDLASADPSLLTMTVLDPKKPFISDGDILCAWFMRLLATANPNVLSSPASRTILVLNVFGMRDLLTNTSPQLLPAGKAYISNCGTAIHSLFTQGDFLSLPLGHLAARIRKDLGTQGTRAQVEASRRLARENGGQQLLYGTSDMALFTFTNWLKARLFETDFSAAIVNEASDAVAAEKRKARGKPAYIHVSGTGGKGFALRGSGNCVGKDHDGNYWLGTIMREEFVPEFVKVVESMR